MNIDVILVKTEILSKSSSLIMSVGTLIIYLSKSIYPANIHLFKVNNRNTRKRCKICSKLRIKTPE